MRELTALIGSIAALLLMIFLIPFVANDFYLTGIYLFLIVVMFWYRHDRKDVTAFFCGLILMTISEWFFLATGVETFLRNSLFGLMPLWLPFLWGFGFVTMKRVIAVLP